jgi:glycosyltransferase involved in cell wall biosynthesis
MRLAIFVTHPVQYHVPLWRALAKHPGLDVKVFYFNDQSVRGGLDRDFGVDVKWDVDLLSGYSHEFLSRDAPLDAPGSMRLAQPLALLRRERPDWVWISGYTHTFERQLVALAPLAGARVIMRAEFSDLSEHGRPFLKRVARDLYLRGFYAAVSRFCYPGANGLAHLRAHGVSPQHASFSPYSVDDALIRHSLEAVDRVEARRELGIGDQHFAFVLSGKLIARKAPMLVVEAIRAHRHRDRVVLIALGDGELRDEFVPAARALLGDRFIFPGFVNQSQLGRYFRAADALVMPSRHETWGLVVNEAMHYGLPVIVTDQTGCHHDLVLPERTGLVIPRDDATALARAMEWLSDEPARARAMGTAAGRHIEGYTVAQSARGVFAALGLDDRQPRNQHR